MTAVLGAHDYILRSAVASGAATAMDTRRAANYAYVQHWTTNTSAILKIEASPDLVNWMAVAIYTATPTQASAQLTTYFPFVRGVVNATYGNATANLFYGAGLY